MKSFLLSLVDILMAACVVMLIKFVIGREVVPTHEELNFYLAALLLIRYHDRRKPDA